jgi:hypothetical protein
MGNVYCNACKNDFPTLSNALKADSNKACKNAGILLSYSCLKNSDGEFCYNSVKTRFLPLLPQLSIAVSTNPNFQLTADQCRKLDCCAYNQIQATSKMMDQSGAPLNQFNPFKNIQRAVDNCVVPVSKSCSSALLN